VDTHLRLVPKSSTLDELNSRYKLYDTAEKMYFLEPSTKIWMLVDPYY